MKLPLLPRWYQAVLSLNFQVLAAYRADFLQSVFSSLLWSAFSTVSVLILTSKTPPFPGMTRFDLLLLAANYGIIVGITHAFCTSGFQSFPETLFRGQLESYLLKPVHALTFLSLSKFRFASIPRVLASLFLTVWLLWKYQQTVTLMGILVFVALGASATLLFYGTYSLCVTFLIWNPTLSNLVELTGYAIGSARYPLEIRKHAPFLGVAIFLPFIMAVNIPTRALLGRSSFLEEFLFLLLCIGAYGGSRFFWNWALKRYTGASG